MYWVPLSLFVKSTLSCPIPFRFVYCYVINAAYDRVGGGGGDATKCIVCVQGLDPLTFSFCRPFSFLIVWDFCGPNYLKC